VNTARTYIVATKDGTTAVIPIETFSFGPEETEAEQQAKVTKALEAKGFVCSVGYPLAVASLLD
jgi:hypothetical protein